MFRRYLAKPQIVFTLMLLLYPYAVVFDVSQLDIGLGEIIIVAVLLTILSIWISFRLVDFYITPENFRWLRVTDFKAFIRLIIVFVIVVFIGSVATIPFYLGVGETALDVYSPFLNAVMIPLVSSQLSFYVLNMVVGYDSGLVDSFKQIGRCRYIAFVCVFVPYASFDILDAFAPASGYGAFSPYVLLHLFVSVASMSALLEIFRLKRTEV